MSQIELLLSVEEARWLRDLLQNPISKNETSYEEMKRWDFFRVLNEGLGEGYRNSQFEPDNIPF